MVEAGRTRTFPYWLEALKAKYLGDGQPYRRAEFDKLLGGFSVSDLRPLFSSVIGIELTRVGNH